MSKIYEVRSLVRSDGKIISWGARCDRKEAENLLLDRFEGDNRTWADKHHQRWWIEEIDTTGSFAIPSLPLPRERYSTQISTVESSGRVWNTLRVEVLDENKRVVAAYNRNHPNLYRTFEPFRQGDRFFALISTDYTATSVMDLFTGKIVASEQPSSAGFCPIGFYVPDWWDVNDGSIIPGSSHWTKDNENPCGDFGFVWGCIWGDDLSWKVQYLDLTQIKNGKILRDERFGYVKLATNHKLAPKDFIDCSFYEGERKVTFAVLNCYDLQTGALETDDFE